MYNMLYHGLASSLWCYDNSFPPWKTEYTFNKHILKRILFYMFNIRYFFLFGMILRHESNL